MKIRPKIESRIPVGFVDLILSVQRDWGRRDYVHWRHYAICLRWPVVIWRHDGRWRANFQPVRLGYTHSMGRFYLYLGFVFLWADVPGGRRVDQRPRYRRFGPVEWAL